MDWSERIGRRIKLRDLHILLAVVQSKSMAKAAEHLAISKPVVSKVIADLEHVLGVRLLERDRHGAEPTIYGAALLKRGIAVFDELREGVKDIAFLIDPKAGDVRIGCNLFLATSFVSAVVDRLSLRFPRIVFHVVARPAEMLHRELSERAVDFLIARWPGARADERADERSMFERLFDDKFVVVAGAQNPWIGRRHIELAELMNEAWVLPPSVGVGVGSVFMNAFRARGFDYPRATVFSDSPHVRMSLLAAGRLLSIFPESALRFPSQRLGVRILPVELPVARVPVGVVTVKNRVLSPVARLFIEHARETAKPLAKRK